MKRYVIPKASIPILILLLLSVVFLSPDQTAQALTGDVSSISSSRSLPEAVETLSCEVSPFGNVLDLYSENEVFVASTSTHPAFSTMPLFLLDLSADNLSETCCFVEIPNGNLPKDHAATTADLDGDGETEVIQSFINNSNIYYVSAFLPDDNVNSYLLSNDLHTNLAIASGNIFGNNNETEQVVLVSVNQVTGALTVFIWSGPGGETAVWRSNQNDLGYTSLVDVAVGNFNGNHKDDISLALYDASGDIQVIVLEYDASHQEGDGSSPNFEYHINDLAVWSANLGDLKDIQVTNARLNNDLLDEIVLAYGSNALDSDLIPDIHLKSLFLYDGQLLEQTSLAYTIQNSQSFNFALTAGDMNGDFRHEVIVAYDSNGGADGDGLVAKVLQGQGLNSPDPTLGFYNDWSVPWSAERSQARYLDAASGDLDRDGFAEILLSLDDGRGLEVIYLDDTLLGTDTLPVTHWIDLDPTQLNSPTALALGDRDNDTLKGVFAPNPGVPGDCRPVVERRITAAIFTPPYWENIQSPIANRGTIGESTTAQSSQESAYTYERSHTLSGFVGLGIQAEYGPGSFESNVRVTTEQEYSQSQTRSSSVYTSTTTTVTTWDEHPFVSFEESYYDCYSYQVSMSGSPITDTASIRNCEYLSSVNGTANLPTWESNYSPKSPIRGANEALTWMPAVRDWANLALFRRDFVTQSSGSNGHRAIDGNLSGILADMTATNQESNPWWEVDLGTSETLTKLRIWGLEDRSSCQDRLTCPSMLTDVFVFVSEQPFVSNNPAILLGDPNVFHASLADISPALTTITSTHPTGRVTSFQLLDSNLEPINGRYVRIQIDRANAILSLAEVQIFGLDYLDPDRYPLAVNDPVPEDGFFQVQLYDPYESNLNAQFKWIDVRGNLLWQWEDSPINSIVGLGSATAEWNLSEETGNSQMTAFAQSHNSTVGVEFDLTAGVIAQVQIGGGMQFSSGITQEDAFTTSWGEGFNMGGYLDGFPGSYGDQSWAESCRYRIRPYFYQLIEESTFGVTTNFNVLDYTIPQSSPAAPYDLDRTTDLQNCRNGNLANDQPSASEDVFEMNVNGSLEMAVIANDLGNQLQLIHVSDPPNGSTNFDNRFITYTPDPGFVGVDSFTYTISDGNTSSETTVEVVVDFYYSFTPLLIK